MKAGSTFWRAEVWVRLTENGTDAANIGDHHFIPESTAGCYRGHLGTVAHFIPLT